MVAGTCSFGRGGFLTFVLQAWKTAARVGSDATVPPARQFSQDAECVLNGQRRFHMGIAGRKHELTVLKLVHNHDSIEDWQKWLQDPKQVRVLFGGHGEFFLGPGLARGGAHRGEARSSPAHRGEVIEAELIEASSSELIGAELRDIRGEVATRMSGEI